MKLFNCKKFILPIATFYCMYNIYSCAAIQSPSGGPKDNTPPVLLASIPESGSINFEGGKVELMFSEYLQEKSLNNAFKILPETNTPAEIKYEGDKVNIYFPDSLSSDQTYILSINRGLKDEHGVPLSQGVQLAFSTGSRIDKSKIRGRVFYNGAASSLLWKLKDSTDHIDFYKRMPDYSIDTNDEGEYEFSYLSVGDYKVVGIDRAFNGKLIDAEYGVYGLPWTSYISVDSIDIVKQSINIIVPNEPRSVKILNAQWLSNRWGMLTFDVPIEQYKNIILVDVISDSFGTRAKTFIDSEKSNILHYVISDSLKYSLKTIIDIAPVYQNNHKVIDSVRIVARVPAAKDTNYISITNYKKNIVLNIDKEVIMPLNIHFSKIMDNASLDSAITLYKDSSLLEIEMTWASPMDLEVLPKINWEPLSQYSLSIIRDKIFINNNKTIKDSIKTIAISTTKYKKFGTLTGNIVTKHFEPLFVRLFSFEKENIFHDAIVNSSSIFKISKVPEGKYYLMVFYDKDGNTKYSQGHLNPYSPSEWFEFFPDTISIRNNWEMEVADIRLSK